MKENPASGGGGTTDWHLKASGGAGTRDLDSTRWWGRCGAWLCRLGRLWQRQQEGWRFYQPLSCRCLYPPSVAGWL